MEGSSRKCPHDELRLGDFPSLHPTSRSEDTSYYTCAHLHLKNLVSVKPNPPRRTGGQVTSMEGNEKALGVSLGLFHFFDF